MNVGDLKKSLEAYPDDMEILARRYSDYFLLGEDDFYTVFAVNKPSVGYIMRSHRSMSEENKEQEKEYLYFDGN